MTYRTPKINFGPGRGLRRNLLEEEILPQLLENTCVYIQKFTELMIISIISVKKISLENLVFYVSQSGKTGL